jgi:hypothetical protein
MVSFIDCINLYNTGNYDLATQLLLLNNENIPFKILYLIAMNKYNNVINSALDLQLELETDTDTENIINNTNNRVSIDYLNNNLFPVVNSLKSAYNLKKNDSFGKIIYALYHLQLNPSDTSLLFPNTLSDIFDNESQSVSKGIKMLEDIIIHDQDNKHAYYILGKMYLNFDTFSLQKEKGNLYLKRCARLNHYKAIKELDTVGVNWKDIDQFGDHCSTWICIPECNPNDKIRSCIGCGKEYDGSGWTHCNCLCFGCKTELNSKEISKYCVNGFMNTLRSFEHFIKLFSCISAITVIGMQNLNSDNVYIAQYLTVVFSTLTLFIKQELASETKSTNVIDLESD